MSLRRLISVTLVFALVLIGLTGPAIYRGGADRGWVALSHDPSKKINIKVELQINGVWTTVTSRGRAAGKVRVKQGQTPGAIQPEMSWCRLTIGNDDGYLTEGNPVSPWYPYIGRGTPIRVSLTAILVGDAGLFTGEIDEMVAVYPGGTSSSMEILAIGTWGVITQNDEPARSASYRTIMATDPVAFWPMEDGTDATAFGSALPGGTPFPVTALAKPGATSPVSWIPAMAGLTITPDTIGDMRAAISGAQQSGNIAFGFGYQRVSGTQTFYETIIHTSNGLRWRVYIDDVFNELALEALDANGAIGGVVGWAPALVDGGLHHVTATIAQSSGNANVAIYVDGVSVSLSGSTINTVTVAAPVLAEVSWFPGTPPPGQQAGELRLGHLAVWDTLPTPATLSNALKGFPGEQAHVRVQRVGAEAGLSITVSGSVSALMGPQPVATLPDAITHCQLADGGLISDSRTSIGLTYRCLSNLYNQAAQVAIVRGALTPNTAPVWDFQEIRNSWTVSRLAGSSGGSSAAASDEAHVTAVGRRKLGTAQLNVATDAQLPAHALWRVHTGTPSGPRYPTLGINLRNVNGAQLADAVLGLEAGDRLTAAATALPVQHPPYGLDQLVVGWMHIVDADEWQVFPVCVPYEPYAVGLAGDGTHPGAWLQTGAGTQLAAELAAGATSLSVTVDGPLFSTVAGDLVASPLSIVFGGEVCPVDSISGGSSPQTIVVRRTLNKLHPVNTKVRVYRPLFATL